MAKVFLMLQYTSPLQALDRTQTSELHGLTRIQLFKLTPRRRHRIVHRMAHRWEPCEICGIVKVLRSDHVRDDEVVGKARDGCLRLNNACGSSAGRDITARASHGGMRRVGRHGEASGVRVVVCRGFREKRFIFELSRKSETLFA
jgi:hypothetical protein